VKTAALAVALALAASPAVAACDPAFPLQTGAGDLTASVRPTPKAIQVGEPFGLEIALCKLGVAGPPALQRVDAEMPAHRHGMNYRPTLVALGGGRWRADGLMFHMPGRWDVTLDIAGGVRLHVPVDIR
jgi:hypothetical protein